MKTYPNFKDQNQQKCQLQKRIRG